MALYTTLFSAVAVTAQQDFFELNSVSNKTLCVHSIRLSQVSDVGDAASEGLAVTLVSGHATSGSGGSTHTPAPLQTGGGASSFTVEINNTTIASTGTPITHYAWNWVIQAPFIEQFTPSEMVYLAPGGRLCLRLSTTPADSLTMSGVMVVEEFGT